MKDALDAEMEKTRLMEESMKKLDEEMKRSDELLAQMIPKQVVDKVKSGLNPIDTCEVRFLLNEREIEREKSEKLLSKQ